MTSTSNRRVHPRLHLCYPIRILADASRGPVLGRTVTRNLSARGAYFSTFEGRSFRVGLPLSLSIRVPHRLAAERTDLMLDLTAQAKVVRVDGPAALRTFGENGFPLTGVAVEFETPLAFQYRWVEEK